MGFFLWMVVGVFLALPGLASQGNPAPVGTIAVTITGIRVQQGGTLLVALYDRESTWLTLDVARFVVRLPVAADSQTAMFRGLPDDSNYAIAVIHDRNGNEKLDMRWFPIPKPKEGSGVSQNHERMGKPRYQSARFALLDGQGYQRIEMRY